MLGGLANLIDLGLGLSGFSNPGIQTSKPQQVVSLVGTDQASKNDVGVNEDASVYFYNDEMLQLLYSWELTVAIVNVFKTTLDDIISRSDIVLSGSKKDMELNEFIKNIGLKQKILDNLYDALYYGQYSFYIDYKEEKIRDLLHPFNLILVKRFGENYKYKLGTLNQPINDVNSDESVIEYDKIGSIFFNLKMISASNSGLKDIAKTGNKFLDSQIVDLTYWRGYSILKDILYILFEHFLKSILRMLLALKNCTRPDLIQANISNPRTPEFNIAEAINDIEAFLNNGDYSFDIRSSNPYSVISTIYNSVMNSIKVVPGLSNFTSLELMQYPPINEKIDQLNNDIERLRTTAIQNKGIPEELFGGNSNRWEVISRNSRFQSVISSLLSSITACMKEVGCNYLKKNFDITISVDELSVNIDQNNYLNNTNFINKISMMGDTLDKLNTILSTTSSLLENPIINKKKLVKYIKSSIQTTDIELSDIIDDNSIKNIIAQSMMQQSQMGMGMDQQGEMQQGSEEGYQVG